MSLELMNMPMTWRAVVPDSYPPSFNNTSIMGKYRAKQKLVLKANADGTAAFTMSSAIVNCHEAVQANDRIVYNGKDSIVISSRPILGVGNQVIEYEVML